MKPKDKIEMYNGMITDEKIWIHNCFAALETKLDALIKLLKDKNGKI